MPRNMREFDVVECERSSCNKTVLWDRLENADDLPVPPGWLYLRVVDAAFKCWCPQCATTILARSAHLDTDQMEKPIDPFLAPKANF